MLSSLQSGTRHRLSPSFDLRPFQLLLLPKLHERLSPVENRGDGLGDGRGEGRGDGRGDMRGDNRGERRGDDLRLVFV